MIEDPARLLTLKETALLDTPDEEAFDRFTKLVSRFLACPVSLVTLIDKDRAFFKSAHGMPEGMTEVREVPFSHSICKHVVMESQQLAIVDARLDPRVQTNAAVQELGVVAYLGTPLRTKEGYVLGTLCAIDMQPRDWSEEALETLQDLAAMVMTEIELRAAGRGLRAKHLELQELERERDGLVHMLVHDLRNPLASTLIGLELVKDSGLDADDKEALAIAQSSTRQLLTMVSDILEVNKAEMCGMQLLLDAIKPARIVELAQQQVAHSAGAAQVRLTTCIEPNLHRVVADGEKLRRVLVNLLANAIQHSPRGGEVTTSVQRSDAGDGLVFTVENAGAGIPPELLDRIFDKYGIAAQRQKKVSSGLGLAFCKKVVEAHGGEITVVSAPGKGSKFRVALPAGVSFSAAVPATPEILHIDS
jgi:signal transduction histidine kinase